MVYMELAVLETVCCPMSVSPPKRGLQCVVRESVLWALLYRMLLVALLVTAAHQMAWAGLRFITSEALLRASHSLGFLTARLSSDTVRVGDGSYSIVVSCTFIDVIVGAIPLLWISRRSVLFNAFGLMLWAQGLFIFNILRLETSFVLAASGVPWVVAHEVLSGFAYFAVWVAIGCWSDLRWSVAVAELRNWMNAMLRRPSIEPA